MPREIRHFNSQPYPLIRPLSKACDFPRVLQRRGRLLRGGVKETVFVEALTKASIIFSNRGSKATFETDIDQKTVILRISFGKHFNSPYETKVIEL